VIVLADRPELLVEVRRLFEEYAASLGFDLAFQGWAEELRGLPGAYAPPGGALFLLLEGETALGCVALRRLDDEAAELKRLYLRPEARGRGSGRALTEAALVEARRLGYGRVRLDTVPGMEAAQELYRALGFREIAPYRENPIPGAAFLELEL
jgi:ribosomal protein S18 acetylase RimI-like enzyme